MAFVLIMPTTVPTVPTVPTVLRLLSVPDVVRGRRGAASRVFVMFMLHVPLTVLEVRRGRR